MKEQELKYDTVLLDFHGTFTSNKGRLAHALNGAYRTHMGRSITRGEFLLVLNRPLEEGKESRISVKDALDRMINGALSTEDKHSLIKSYLGFEDHIYIPKHTYILRAIYELGATCVVVTNGPEHTVRGVLDQWGLTQYVAGVYGRGPKGILPAAGIPKKPSPEVLDFVIDDLRGKGHLIKRPKTLMVGDHQVDIGAGNSVGIHTAFMVTGPNQLPEYYQARPTYALLDQSSLEPSSPWLNRENVHLFRDLPKIIKGDL